MRAIPEPLATELSSLPCRGTFEAHMTVDAATAERRADLVALCETMGVKCVLIELAAGRTPSQPMTAHFHRGELATVLAEVDAHYGQLVRGGFEVVRVKLEAVANNVGVPVTDDDARAFASGRAYFEFHAKLRLPISLAATELGSLRALCREHDAHLSLNNRKSDHSKATFDRFVTLRLRGVGKAHADARFDTLVASLRENGYEIVGVKRELTIYDSRASLDAGWLEPDLTTDGEAS